jgi:hypothetical protein
MGIRMYGWAQAVRRDHGTWLQGVLLVSGATSIEVASQARPLSRELWNMPIDSVTGRHISPLTAAALCIKPRPLLTAAQTRKVDILQGSSSDFAAITAPCDAIPRPASRWPQGKIGASAQRRAAFRDLCNAAVRPQGSPGHRGGDQCHDAVLEQWAGRRPDQSIEGAEEINVWTSRSRITACPHAANHCIGVAPSLRQNLFKLRETDTSAS